MFETGEPRTGAEIAGALLSLQEESARYLGTLTDEVFLAPQQLEPGAPRRGGPVWSPAEHVRHLTKSVRPVARALALPRLVPRLLFGAHRGPSRTFAEVRAVYRAALEDGAQAGRFAPTQRPVPADAAAFRRSVMGALDAEVRGLAARVREFPEPQLDVLRLPHPVLGKLTVREMLFFTLYHGAHHVRKVRERAEAAGTGS
jgi:hypothetical protein